MAGTPENTVGGALYEITPDFHERVLKQISESSQAQMGRDLSQRLGYDVDPSTISNIVRLKYPSTRYGAVLAQIYGWPIPPIARTVAVDNFAAEAMEEIRMANPTRYEHLKLIIEGERLKLRGEALAQEGLSKLGNSERGMRRLDSPPAPGDNESDEDEDGE